MEPPHLHIEKFTGKAMLPFLSSLAHLRISVFRDFPYLYEGTQEYEEKYLEIYAQSENAALFLVMDSNTPVGASTCIPMVEETEGVKEFFETSDYPSTETLYLGESILLNQYRGQGMGVKFFEQRELHAKQLGLSYTAFCSVIRPANHPLRPKEYQPLDAFWKHRGYQPLQGIHARMDWKDIDQPQETEKELLFWVKTI